jgi:hypothetical protein
VKNHENKNAPRANGAAIPNAGRRHRLCLSAASRGASVADVRSLVGCCSVMVLYLDGVDSRRTAAAIRPSCPELDQRPEIRIDAPVVP